MYPITNLLISLLILTITLSNSFAAPLITSLTGSPTNGSTITINGSGFGTKSTAYPMILSYDDFRQRL